MGLVRKLYLVSVVQLCLWQWFSNIPILFLFLAKSLLQNNRIFPLKVIEIWYRKNVFQIFHDNKLLQPKISNKPKDSHKDLSEATALYECSSALFCHIMLYPKGILDELTKNICNRKNLPNDKEANS